MSASPPPTAGSRPVVLLGPQRHRPLLRRVLEDLGVGGPVAIVSSGWEEREAELGELEGHVDRPVVRLDLFTRAERLLAGDGELAAAWRRRRLAWGRLARLHRVRVNAAIEVVQALAAEPASDVRDAEVDDAIRHVARLDARHEGRIARLLDEFDRRWSAGTHRAIERERDEVHAALDGAEALLVAGGDVGVLHRTLRLFGLPRPQDPRPVVAWSAGAMALGGRIVLFHDRPPWGFSHAEVHGPGLGLAGDLVPLPHARRRLVLDDRLRVSVLAGRLAPSLGVAMDEGSRIDLEGGRVVRARGVRALHVDGGVRPLPATAAGARGVSGEAVS